MGFSGIGRCYCTAWALQLMTRMQGWAKKHTVKAKRQQPNADIEKQQHVQNGCFQLGPLKADFKFKDSNKWCKTNTTIRQSGWQHRTENGRKTEKPSICLKELTRKKRFHEGFFFFTSQRAMHPFLSMEIFCRSEGEALLNKTQDLIHVEGKSFFFFQQYVTRRQL